MNQAANADQLYSAATRREARSPSKVTKAVQRRLQQSPYYALRSICCEHQDGAIVLRGQVPSFYFKQLAQEMIRNIDGVEAIANALEVDGANGW